VAWDKSKSFLDKVQLGSIMLYLVCLGGYAIPPVAAAFNQLQVAVHFKLVEIAGFTFFSLFIASTVLLSYEADEVDDGDSAGAAS
jgi:hypothetical protein